MWGVVSKGVLCSGHVQAFFRFVPYSEPNSIWGLLSNFELTQKCCVF